MFCLQFYKSFFSDLLAVKNGIIEAVSGKEKEKDGSRLSTVELNCFRRVVIPAAQLKLKSDSKFADVKAIIRKHTENLLITFRSGQVKEDVVQSNSLALLNELNGLFGAQFDVLNKATGSNEIKYKTILLNDISEHVANVNGETDEVLLFHAVCVQYFEDKALKEVLNASKHLAEALAELKGFAEAFKSACGREAPCFWGIMRNGTHWLFLRRVFSDGTVTFANTVPIKIAEDPTSQSNSSGESVFNESNLDVVTKLVCNIMTDVLKLTSIIEQVGIGEASPDEEAQYGSDAGDEDNEDEFNSKKRGRDDDDDQEESSDPKKQTITKGGLGSKQSQLQQSSLSGLSAYDMIGRWNYLHTLPLAMRNYVVSLQCSHLNPHPDRSRGMSSLWNVSS